MYPPPQVHKTLLRLKWLCFATSIYQCRIVDASCLLLFFTAVPSLLKVVVAVVVVVLVLVFGILFLLPTLT